MKKLAEYGELAAALGCPHATVVLAPAGERPYHENFEFHRHRLQEISPRCGRPASDSPSASRRPSTFAATSRSSSFMTPTRSCCC